MDCQGLVGSSHGCVGVLIKWRLKEKRAPLWTEQWSSTYTLTVWPLAVSMDWELPLWHGCWMSNYRQASLSQPIINLNHPLPALGRSHPWLCPSSDAVRIVHPELLFPLPGTTPFCQAPLVVPSWKLRPALLGSPPHVLSGSSQPVISVMSSSPECTQAPASYLHWFLLSPLPTPLYCCVPPPPPLHSHLDPDLGFQPVLVFDLSLILSFRCLAYKFM